MDPRGSAKVGSISPNLHKGSNGDHDIEVMIQKSRCAKLYFILEECIGENDRDWRKCQKEVLALKKCSMEATEKS